MEAISGVPFPKKDRLCSRFATELVLRRAATASIRISIIADLERTAEEKERIGRFSPTPDFDNNKLGDVIEKAKQVMGLSDTKAFSTDILRVEICGPQQPHLTLVDLPGLFRAGNKEQHMDDANIVRKMVRQYMERGRSIILAVVSAKNDFVLQEVTGLARELDPSGVRTLGLITKPDTLTVGSGSEEAFVKLAQNKDVEFWLGWHVLMNSNSEIKALTSAERGRAEEEFFSTGVWASVDPLILGVRPLRR